MKPAPFEYHAPESIADVTTLLGEHGDDAKVLAGGQSLVPLLAMRLTRFPHLVDLNRVEELRGIERENGTLTIKAMTRQAIAEHDDTVAAAAPLLAKALPFIGHFQIRNRGTVGGSIAHADPASELPAVAVALDAEDRRSLRALIRGASEGAPADTRLAGLVPTPTLPERLLRELAERGSIREQGVLLLAAGHPCGPAVLAAASDREPDLFRIELAVARTLAERAVRGSRRAGRFLRDYVAATIDRDNCRTALVLAAIGIEEPTASLFLPGGGLRPEEFERATATRDPVMAARALGAAGATRDVAPILLQHATSPADLERALEDRAVTTVQREARLNPLGPAPVLLFLHRLRQQSIALARLVWGAELGVPPAALAGAVVA